MKKVISNFRNYLRDFFKTDIGLEFKNQMLDWFLSHPEINHQWNNNELKIFHPTKVEDFIRFYYDEKTIRIYYKDLQKEFIKKEIPTLFEQVIEVRGFWMNELLKDLAERKPKMKFGECAVMKCNSAYGQVLTIDGNRFTGWGEIYQIFGSVAEARQFCEKELNDKIELHIYNHEYTYLEQIK
jgi:hypothetical protein